VPELEQTIRILTESTCFARPGPADGERVPGADPGDDWEDVDRGDDAMTLPTFVVIGAMKAGTSVFVTGWTNIPASSSGAAGYSASRICT
jgi:hypothetical protein